MILYFNQENSYFGSSHCSILKDARDSVYNNFGVEVNYRGSSRRKKDCVIRLTSSQFEADQVDLTILLIVELIPGLPTHCDSPISAKATIRVNFCRLGTPGCLQSRTIGKAEILSGNMAEGDAGGSEQEEYTDRLNYTKSLLDKNASLILAIGLIVLLVTICLIFALIYFWCPSVCCCFKNW